MNGYSANRVVNTQVFQQVQAPHDDQTAANADEKCADRVYPVTRAGNRHQAAQETVNGQAQIPFPGADIGGEQRGQASGTGSQRRIKRDSANTLNIHRGECAAGVEAVPAKPQDQAAARADDQIVRGHWATAIPLENTAQAWAKYNGSGQRDRAADGVNNRRTGEVTEAERLHHGQPTVGTPAPVADDGIDETCHAYAV